MQRIENRALRTADPVDAIAVSKAYGAGKVCDPGQCLMIYNMILQPVVLQEDSVFFYRSNMKSTL